MKLLLINNDYIKKLLIFIIKNDNDEKIDFDLFFLRKKVESIINGNNQIFFNNDINLIIKKLIIKIIKYKD